MNVFDRDCLVRTVAGSILELVCLGVDILSTNVTLKVYIWWMINGGTDMDQ